MAKLIYYADDEESLRYMVQVFLENEGFRVETFPNGKALSERMQQEMPDLLLLDVMMPGEDGLSICNRLRRSSEIPIIIVSAKDTPIDRVTGLTMGSDDYLVKPFLPLELVARVKALLRRSGRQEEETEDYRCGNLLLQSAAHVISIAGGGESRGFSATPMEFEFLQYLMKHREAAVSKAELQKNVWKYADVSGDARVTDDLVKRLRKKLSSAGASVQIETVWGFGYRITALEEQTC